LHIDLNKNAGTGVFLPKIMPPKTKPAIKLFNDDLPKHFYSKMHAAL
jgi:hypothetical protein